MEDYEIIKNIENFKKRILIVRIFMLIMTIISIYVIFKEKFFIGIFIFILGMIVTGIIGFPAQMKIKKLSILLEETNE